MILIDGSDADIRGVYKFSDGSLMTFFERLRDGLPSDTYTHYAYVHYYYGWKFAPSVNYHASFVCEVQSGKFFHW